GKVAGLRGGTIEISSGAGADDGAAGLGQGEAARRAGPAGTTRGVGLNEPVRDERLGSVSQDVESRDVTRLRLRDVRWTKDLRVSGVVVAPSRVGEGTADVVVAGPDGMNGSLKVRWTEGVPRARASVRGTFGATVVVAETPAP